MATQFIVPPSEDVYADEIEVYCLDQSRSSSEALWMFKVL